MLTKNGRTLGSPTIAHYRLLIFKFFSAQDSFLPPRTLRLSSSHASNFRHQIFSSVCLSFGSKLNLINVNQVL